MSNLLEMTNGVVLAHASAPYDPVKAHEYYEKNKQLKGRKPGAAPTPAAPRTRKTVGSGSVKVTMNGMEYHITPKQLAEQQAYAAARVQKITAKIHTLQRTLRTKMIEAKRKEKEAKKPDSAAEKRAKAKESEKYRDKHKQELKNKSKKAAEKKSNKPNLNTVEGIQTAIDGAHARLQEAVNRQRALASATKG